MEENIKLILQNILINQNIEIIKIKSNDVLSNVYKIINNDNNNNNYILKIYKNSDEKLKNLNLNEIYFYKYLSKEIKKIINIPEEIKINLDDNDINNNYILFNCINDYLPNNMFDNIYEIKEILNIFDELSKIHIKYWNKNIEFYEIMKNQNYKNIYEISDKYYQLYILNYENKKSPNELSSTVLNINDCYCNSNEDITNLINNIKKYDNNNNFSDNFTLIHGDLKNDNILINKFNHKITFIDFNLTCKGNSMNDITQLLVFNLEHEILRKNFKYLIEYYINILALANIDYNFKLALKDSKKSLGHFILCYFLLLMSSVINSDNKKKSNKIQNIYQNIKFILEF